MKIVRYKMTRTGAPCNENRFLISAAKTLFAVIFSFLVSSVAIGLPLSTDDAGTLGKNRFKIELNIEQSEAQMIDSKETTNTREVSIIHGIQENLNGFISIPYRDVSTQQPDGNNASNRGLGDAKLGLKWRYFEQSDFSLGLKGAISVATGDVERKLGNGQATYGVNAIASYELQPWEAHFNLGNLLQPNSQDASDRIANISTAVAFKLNSRWQVMADIGATSSNGYKDALVFTGIGITCEIVKNINAEMGWKHSLSANVDEISKLARLTVSF